MLNIKSSKMVWLTTKHLSKGSFINDITHCLRFLTPPSRLVTPQVEDGWPSKMFMLGCRLTSNPSFKCMHYIARIQYILHFILYFNVFLWAIFTQELFFGFSQLFISCMIYNKSTFYYNIKKIKMNLFFEKTGGV